MCAWLKSIPKADFRDGKERPSIGSSFNLCNTPVCSQVELWFRGELDRNRIPGITDHSSAFFISPQFRRSDLTEELKHRIVHRR